MDCKQVPPADVWAQAPDDVRREYQRHARFCQTCRKRVLTQAPEQLLPELRGEALPDEFWMGFWPSLEARIRTSAETPAPPSRVLRVARWAAVLIAATSIVMLGRTLPKPQPFARPVAPVLQMQPDAYPLVEEIRNPNAVYYIFQPGSGEKIVMVIDPDMEL